MRLFLAVLATAALALCHARPSVVVRIQSTPQRGSLVNIHLDWETLTLDAATLTATYGSCDPKQSSSTPPFARFDGKPERVVWAVEAEAESGGCVSIHCGQHLLGQSEPLTLASPPHKRRSPPLLGDFDSLGAWFDGVEMIKERTQREGGVVASGTNKSIAIVGAGVSGLAAGIMLDSVGVRNWHIIEASNRVGGRLRTKYVGGTQEWAEMGPMRLPHTVTYDDGETLEYTDHQLTFQLARTLNAMNGNASAHRIDFIPWIQHHPNELIARRTGRHPDGRIPTRAEIAADASLGPPVPDGEEYKRTKAAMDDILLRKDRLKALQRDVWRAHRQAMDEGLDDWSEQAMMRHVFHASQNVTDEILAATDYDVFWDELHHNSNLGLSGGMGTTNWLAIDGGFSRLGKAFVPHVGDRLTLNRKIRKLESLDGGQRTRLSWFPSPTNRTHENAEYDYTLMTVPFTMTRFMELPHFSSVLTRAISEGGLRFKSACKVALLFRERFWERGERPIFGGYSMPSSESVGALYYPVYGLNESRPGIIMHYRGGDWSDRFVSFSEQEHVLTVLDAIAELHGEGVRELYTGDYERLCWLQDEHTATSWCRPDVQQHKLYIPAYHRTEHHTIFLGEHTAPTHAWVSSSLHSSVRACVQLLLDMGLVDEAKELNRKWMGRWIRL